ncbi:MAG TPA: 4-hydroxyphenylpyruvate dioxygenase [Blastocatellia bacterium]|nr:4-hydroxyphenylpyruvate dioxygenase [Blastocatellia bacterium]
MSSDLIKIKKIHHLEFYTGNAKQADYYYRQAFGFSRIAYAGLETGDREQTAYALQQGTIKLVLTTPHHSDSHLADHLRRHGDGVKDIALEVEDADQAFQLAVSRGAIPNVEPRTLKDDHGSIRQASVKVYGDTIHSFISRANYQGPFLPGFIESRVEGRSADLLRIDHFVANVELGKMAEWEEWYQRVFGFTRFMTFDDKDISTEYSALNSVVMANDSRSVKFPINEPAPGRRKSQIQEYLECYDGPGVQHIALTTADIVSTVSRLRANGVEFLEVPDTYYGSLTTRVGRIDEEIEQLRQLKLLVDRDEEGYLLQIFTKPVEDRPTLFFEIIQRKGCQGFGKGNFKALFEAIEREQARRGNLV